MRFRAFFCVLVGFCVFLHVFLLLACPWALLERSWALLGHSGGALGALMGRSWALLDALGALLRRSWSTLGRSWDALGALLGKNMKKTSLRWDFGDVFGRGFGRVLAILNVLVKNLRLHRPSHRFFYFFGIVRELLAKARTLNFVAPVDVLWGFSKVDVLRTRRVGTRDDLRKNIKFTLRF